MKLCGFNCNGAAVSAISVLCLAVALGGILLHIELDTTDFEFYQSMASEAQANMERFKGENHSAFIVGYSGATGKALIKDLNELKIFKKVVLIGRKEIPLEVGPEFEQKVVNFDKLEEHKDLFKDLDVGFCTLGGKRMRDGAELCTKIDRDYVIDTARVAKDQGCQQFALCTSMGADKNSMTLYAQLKGQAEEGVSKLNFDRFSIYRPGAILTEREQTRIGEKVVGVLFKPIFWLFPTSMSVPVESLARAMINTVVAPLKSSSEPTIISNKGLHQVSGLPPRGGKN